MDITKIAEFIKPELLILVPVLFFSGEIIKNIQSIKDQFIPALLGLLGIVLSTLYIVGTVTMANYQDVVLAVFVAVTQGILVAGGSVYFDQMLKQLGNK